MGDATMVMRYNDDRQLVLDAIDLVHLIGQTVTLRPKGREFVGLCPFHDDTRPSLYVVPHKGIFKCFSCGAGGSAFDFVMRYHSMDFKEALEFLAEQGGVKLTAGRRRPRRDGAGGSGDDSGARHSDSDNDELAVSGADLVRAHRTALDFYQTLLRHEKHGRRAREILENRGIPDEMIERFQLGSAPAGGIWDGLAQTLKKKGISMTPFEAAGLIYRRRDGVGYVDRFRNRLIFPIHDPLGRPVAFGARQIDPEDEPKYVNSPEHVRFSKSRTLYGLHLARRAIQEHSSVVVVEGYTDVIACHKAGFENVVATLGTALTRDHARTLQRLCDRVVLLFDGDRAGKQAADRAVEICFRADVDARLAMIPGGEDPAELLTPSGGPDRFRSIIEDAQDAFSFLLESLRQELERVAGGVSARQRLVEAFLARLAALGFHKMSPLRRDLTLSRLADLLALPVRTILQSLPRAGSEPRVRTDADRRAPADSRSGAGSPERPEVSIRNKSGEFAPRRSPDPGSEATGTNRVRRDAEAGLLGCLMQLPELISAQPGLVQKSEAAEEAIRLDASWFTTRETRDLYELIETLPVDQRNMRGILSGLAGDPSLSELATDWSMTISRQTNDEPQPIAERYDAFLKALRHLEEQRRIEEAATVRVAEEGAKPGDGRSTEDQEDDGLVGRVAAHIDSLRLRGGNRTRLGRAENLARSAAAGDG